MDEKCPHKFGVCFFFDFIWRGFLFIYSYWLFFLCSFFILDFSEADNILKAISNSNYDAIHFHQFGQKVERFWDYLNKQLNNANAKFLLCRNACLNIFDSLEISTSINFGKDVIIYFFFYFLFLIKYFICSYFCFFYIYILAQIHTIVYIFLLMLSFYYFYFYCLDFRIIKAFSQWNAVNLSWIWSCTNDKNSWVNFLVIFCFLLILGFKYRTIIITIAMILITIIIVINHFVNY